MNVLVTGSRNWTDWHLVNRTLDKWHNALGKPGSITEITEGCARGADAFAENWARDNKVRLNHYPAAWDVHGKSAGFLRNLEMLAASKPDLVIAFSDDLLNSRGTRHMVSIALADHFTVITISHP